MKILLIDPPFYRILGFYNRYFPFGLVTLATYLRNNGYADVRVYDADANVNPEHIDYAMLPQKYPLYLKSFKEPDHPVWQDVKKTLNAYRPDVVGISIWTTFAAASFYTATLTKKILPECVVIMGGPHATSKADEILSIASDVDYVIRGEGEQALLTLLDQIKNQKEDFDDVKGLAFRQGKAIRLNPMAKASIDLNRFPYPDRGLLMNAAQYDSEDMGLIMTTRGCPFACTYCATNIRRVSFRTAEHIIDEIKHVKERYKTVQFTFKDDSFTVNPKKVVRFCELLIKERLRINWECNTRVNLIDEPLLRLMKRAGCNFIKVGIESGSQRILKRMNKGIRLEEIEQASRLLRKVGIHWTGYFMMGIPGETEADIHKTISFLHKIKPDFACIGVYEPFPGTAMFEEGVEKGLIKSEMTLYDFFHTLPNHYYMRDSSRNTDQISPARFRFLEQKVKKIIHHYNRHGQRVIKMGLARIRTYLNDGHLLLSDFKKFLSY